MHCPECGTKISPENAHFCYHCGQKLFVVSIESETKTAASTTDSNQTGIAGSVQTGGDFVGRDHHEGKSFVFHLAQPGVYKVILSATLSVLFVFLVARTLLLVQQINNTPQPGTVTVHSGVLTTATAEADNAADARATVAVLKAALSASQVTTQVVGLEATLSALQATAQAAVATTERAIAAATDAVIAERANATMTDVAVTSSAIRANATVTAEAEAQATATAVQVEAQATVAVELTLGAEARATLAVLQAPTGTPTPTQTIDPTPAVPK